MKTRRKIQSLIENKIQKIEKLRSEIIDLKKEAMLLSDKEQKFTEAYETRTYRENRKVVKKDVLIGRIHWIEYFVDEDTSEVVTINRTRVVRENGEWIN